VLTAGARRVGLVLVRVPRASEALQNEYGIFPILRDAEVLHLRGGENLVIQPGERSIEVSPRQTCCPSCPDVRAGQLKGSDSPQGNNVSSRGPLLARRARVKPTGARMRMNAALMGPNPSADGRELRYLLPEPVDSRQLTVESRERQRVATVRVVLTVGFCRVQEPTVNSNSELTVATSYLLPKCKIANPKLVAQCGQDAGGVEVGRAGRAGGPRSQRTAPNPEPRIPNS